MLATVLVLVLVAPGAAAARRPRAPVVMVSFDELPVASLLGANGHVDRVRYPNFAALARGSTWYANATTVADATKFAVPSILTGSTPRRGQSADFRGHPRNIFTLFHAQGYRLKVSEEATSLCPYRSCRRRHGARYFLARDRVGRFRDFIRSIGPPGRPTLYYKHALLPHVPWIFGPTTQRFDESVIGQIRGLNSSEISVFDRTLVRQSWQRHLLQVGAVDTLLGELMARMKATGLYDRAVFVVLADHGVSFRVGATDRRTIVPANARDIAPIPLFVKLPGQRRGRIDRALARTYDVLPTIAHAVGLRLPQGLNGRAASSRRVHRRRRVTIISRAKIGHITLSRRRLVTLERQALRRRLVLFGSGARSLYDFGPNRALLLRPVDALRVIGRGRLRATLNGRGDYLDVHVRAPFVPAHVTGRILGGRRGARRDVALAINGGLFAVSRSVHLRGRRAEYYSFLTHPAALIEGVNNIEVFTVGRSRGRYLLRRIYGRPASAAAG